MIVIVSKLTKSLIEICINCAPKILKVSYQSVYKLCFETEPPFSLSVYYSFETGIQVIEEDIFFLWYKCLFPQMGLFSSKGSKGKKEFI